MAQAFLIPKKDHVKTQIRSSLGIDVIKNFDYMTRVNEARKSKRDTYGIYSFIFLRVQP